MKKILFVLLTIFLLSMVLTNPSENDFIQKIQNSKDPYDEFYSSYRMKNAQSIIKGDGLYFVPLFTVSYTNLGIISIAKVNYGWSGTLRIDGMPLGERVEKETENHYIILFGNTIKI